MGRSVTTQHILPLRGDFRSSSPWPGSGAQWYTGQFDIVHAGDGEPRTVNPGTPGAAGVCGTVHPVLTQKQQAVSRFVSQSLFLQLLLDLFVGLPAFFFIHALIFRGLAAVAQTPHACWFALPSGK